MTTQHAVHAVLAGIGLDRVGIVEEMSLFLLRHDVEIVETQLCNLRGVASFLLVVAGTADALNAVRRDLTQQHLDARMTLELLPATAVEDTAPRVGFPYRLVSRGRDHAGGVNRLSHLLRVMNVNIENFKIDKSADDPGQFELNLLLSVPRQTPVNMLRGYLEQLCGEIGISCDLMCA